MLSARAAVMALKQYRPPVAGREGLRMDFNENTLGCSPKVLRCLLELTADGLARYPNREDAESAASEFLKVHHSEVLATNGIDEAIHLLCSAYLSSGDEVLTVVPTFAMYELLASATGAQVRRIKTIGEFNFPTEYLLAAITRRTRMIIVANPNNPTGRVAPAKELVSIVQAAPHAVVLIDEAYFEFYGQSLLHQLGRFPNLFLTRTFSKAYGLAGLRLGLLVGPREQLAMLRRIASPYNVNAVAIACLKAAITDQEFIQQYVAEVREGRRQLQERLEALSFKYWPSEANFVLIRIGPERVRFIEGMRNRGILIRDRHGDVDCDGCVRVTLGTSEHNKRLLSAFDDIAGCFVTSLKNR